LIVKSPQKGKGKISPLLRTSPETTPSLRNNFTFQRGKNFSEKMPFADYRET